MPPHLPRVRVEYDLAESDKVCPLCQERLTKVQEVVSEQLNVIPAQLQVIEHVRFKYACRYCYGCIKTADLPAQAIDKGLPSSSLLSHILVNKFADHLPFYRQQRWFNRHQYGVSRSTLWGWEKSCAIAAYSSQFEHRFRFYSNGDSSLNRTSIPFLSERRFQFYSNKNPREAMFILN